jgi:phosphoglycerol transferase MdoB-like AlkP superfamily enzyme
MTDIDRSPGISWTRSRYGFAGLHLVSLLLLWFVFRTVLYVAFRPASVPAPDVLGAFLSGLERDLVAGLVMSAPLLAWMLLVPNSWGTCRWHRRFFWLGYFVFWFGQLFVLFAEFFFFEEFKSRFNTVAVDYLIYPHEVFINIWDSYPVLWVLLACGAFAGSWVWVARRWFGRMWDSPVSARSKALQLGGAVVFALTLMPTVRWEGTEVSHERVLNEMGNNGTIAFVAAAMTRHLDYAAFYKTLPLAEAYQRTRRLLNEPDTALCANPRSIRKHVAGDPARPRLNVVLVLEESLGSEFWGALGRRSATLTPEMDRLAAEEGLLFTHLYASGNRTVRGLEGVLSSFPPLPGDSIVKRTQSDNVETMARVLKRDDYATLFVYGGRGVFDGMRSFALQNGYDRFIEQKHFKKPTFTTIWGVCDEDIFSRTLEEMRALHQSGQPFFATVLSVSNHKPYTYPKGRISENPDRQRRDYAVKYSDYALGQFFKAAAQEPFWTNTIFAVVADHGARVYGSQSIPIHSYEIPLLIVGPAVVQQSKRVPSLGCSLDVAPTLLGLLGRPYESLFFGRDLLKSPPAEGRVLISHNRDIGLYAKECLVVLGLMQHTEFYQGDPKVVNLVPVAQPEMAALELERDATALFQVADDLYMHRRYRLDGEPLR